MKKILMLLAVIALMLGVSGQAMATPAYFVDGHLIRVVYSTVDQVEVVTDLGAFNATDGSSSLSLSFSGNPFPVPGSSTFPNSNWGDLQVAYFERTGTEVWVSGQNGDQMNIANKFDNFQTAVEYIYVAAQAAAGGGAQAVIDGNDEQSYESVMNFGDIAPGSFAQFTPDQDGEQNLGSLGVGVSSVDSYLYYYGDPDTLSYGVQVARISTNGSGNSSAEGGHLVVVMPSNAPAGSKVVGQVFAADSANYINAAYKGIVNFTSSDTWSDTNKTGAKLPADGKTKFKNGIATFTVTMPATTEALQITATDSVDSTMSDGAKITVKNAALKKFVVSAPAVTTGTAFNFTVTAVDAYGNTVPTYAGTLKFTTSDKGYGKDPNHVSPVLPADSTLTDGVGTFSATLLTGGMPGATKDVTQTITVTDQTPDPKHPEKVKALAKGTSNKFKVTWAPATKLVLGVASPITAGKFVATVTANDEHNYFTQNISGLVSITTTDADLAVVLPVAAELKKGVGVFKGTLKTPGSTITADGTVAGVSNATSDALSW